MTSRIAGTARDHEETPTRVHIGGLPVQATDGDLRALVAPYDIKSVKLVRRTGGGSTQYAFVVLNNAAEAARLIKELNVAEVDGFRLQVDYANGLARRAPHNPTYVLSSDDFRFFIPVNRLCIGKDLILENWPPSQSLLFVRIVGDRNTLSVAFPILDTRVVVEFAHSLEGMDAYAKAERIGIRITFPKKSVRVFQGPEDGEDNRYVSSQDCRLNGYLLYHFGTGYLAFTTALSGDASGFLRMFDRIKHKLEVDMDGI